MDEEIYDEGEVDSKQMVIENKPKPESNKPTSNGGTTASMTLKERMALLQAKTNGTAAPMLTPKKPPIGGVKSIPGLTNNNAYKPPLANKPKFSPPTSSKQAIVFNKNDIKSRKNSLKTVMDKRASQMSDGGSFQDQEGGLEEGEEVVMTKDGRKFKRLSFAKKPSKPNKPAALKDVSLPVVKYMDVKSGVEQRIGGGRGQRESEDLIPSMTEEEELDETPTLPPPPALHPTSPRNAKKPLPPPPELPEMLEEVYDDAEAEASVDQEGQELYEDFDEVRPGVAELKPPTPDRTQTPEPSPDPARKISKAEKEKEKKEKLKQEKIAKEREKQRQKEIKDRETFMKKFKLSEEDVVTSHFVKARKAASGGKLMLVVAANEAFQLVRRTDCPSGKWIVRNPNTDAIGLVDSSNMIDLDAPPLPSERRPVPQPSDEEIYEEI